VAALNGHAIGGGLELALSCDLRLASEEAKVGMPPARLGLVYSHTGLRKFVDAIGAARTRELFFTARNISAQQAERWGLVSEVVPADELAERAVGYAAQIAALAPLSQRGNKRVIGELLAAEGALDPDTERELVELREACFRSDDFYEGVQAFAEKRKPQWRAQ
jgi:enoyl-CoA hydratase/carnithine racemase